MPTPSATTARVSSSVLPAIRRIPVALQLWSVREDCQKDFAGTVAAIGGMGYAGVELAGYGPLDAAGAKAALDAAGLKVAGLHVGYDWLKAHVDQVVQEALLLGTRHITCPWWPPEQFTTAEACRRIGRQLDEIGARLHQAGLQLGYHNHAAEARVIEGHTVFAWILDASKPEHLVAEPDVYWLEIGGCSASDFLRLHGARCPLIHLKDGWELGSGPINLPSVLAAAEACPALEWLIVEQENFKAPPLESARANFHRLRAWGLG